MNFVIVTFALIQIFLWLGMVNYEKISVKTIILVFRSCHVSDARQSCSHLCKDFWFGGQKSDKIFQGPDSLQNNSIFASCWCQRVVGGPDGSKE